MKETTQKKIAAINDLSGYGRCALTVAIPVISYMKIQCCPVPTSILSNHTGYEEYFLMIIRTGFPLIWICGKN